MYLFVCVCVDGADMLSLVYNLSLCVTHYASVFIYLDILNFRWLSLFTGHLSYGGEKLLFLCHKTFENNHMKFGISSQLFISLFTSCKCFVL